MFLEIALIIAKTKPIQNKTQKSQIWEYYDTHFIQLPGCCLFSLVLTIYLYMRILVIWNSLVSLRKVKKNYMLCKPMTRIRGLVWSSLKSVYFSLCETQFCLKPDETVLLQSISFQMEGSTLELDVSLSRVILKDGSDYDLTEIRHW